jgi:hypothetical protein
MLQFPGAVLWLPTAVNAFIAAEILQLAWERMRGGYNIAQGEMGPLIHIFAISAPIAVFLLVGWAVLAVLRENVPHSRESTQKRSVAVLAIVNVAAPFLLFFELRWLM